MTISFDQLNRKKTLIIFKSIAMICVFYVFWKNAWVSDDAMITMRVVDNFVDGYGLRWNIVERVQVFTHPLWLFVLSLFHLLLDDPYLTIYIASLLVSLCAAGILLFGFVKDVQTLIWVSIMLISSHAYIDYSSSGLENPLTHLLVLSFAYLYLKGNKEHRFRFLGLTFIAGLAAFNRLDTVLCFLPVLFYEMFHLRHKFSRVLWQGLLGVVPIIGWEVFSLIYYGFLFPNTYYAKLNTGIGSWRILKWGVKYVLAGLTLDHFTYVIILLAFILLLAYRDWKLSILCSGALIYSLYVVVSVADFMAGRFFSLVFLIALIVLIDLRLNEKWRLDKRLNFIVAIAAFFLTISYGRLEFHPLFLEKSMVYSDEDFEYTYGVSDEKLFYYSDTAWRNYTQGEIPHDWGRAGNNFKENNENQYMRTTSIGFRGYHAGSAIYVSDDYSLADPLRARLPMVSDARQGHFERPYPVGYQDTILGGFEQNLIADPSLATYFDKLWLVIHEDDLFSKERLMTIWEFNTGKFDGLIEKYLASDEWINFENLAEQENLP